MPQPLRVHGWYPTPRQRPAKRTASRAIGGHFSGCLGHRDPGSSLLGLAVPFLGFKSSRTSHPYPGISRWTDAWRYSPKKTCLPENSRLPAHKRGVLIVRKRNRVPRRISVNSKTRSQAARLYRLRPGGHGAHWGLGASSRALSRRCMGNLQQTLLLGVGGFPGRTGENVGPHPGPRPSPPVSDISPRPPGSLWSNDAGHLSLFPETIALTATSGPLTALPPGWTARVPQCFTRPCRTEAQVLEGPGAVRFRVPRGHAVGPHPAGATPLR